MPTMVGAQEVRDSFYKKQSHRLGMPVNWIKDILSKHFDSFSIVDMPNYIQVLNEEAYLERTRENIKRKIKKQPMPVKCPVPSCEGETVPRDGAIVCSISGIRHILAAKLARRMHITPEQAVEILEEMMEQKNGIKETDQETQGGSLQGETSAKMENQGNESVNTGNAETDPQP